MESQTYWNAVYSAKSAESVSWYAPHLTRSLQYVGRAAPDKGAAIIDVGGGESTLVDDLLAGGYCNLTVLDISATALEVARQRVGVHGSSVTWRAADVLDADWPAHSFDVWHDRAVFHFLTTNDQRERYVARVVQALKPDGFAIVATFGPHGPTQCSGLAVSRYTAGELHARFGAQFALLESTQEVHTTPWGTPQQFVYCFCRRHTR